MRNKGYFLSLVVFPILLLLILIFSAKLLGAKATLTEGLKNELTILNESFQGEKKSLNNTTYWEVLEKFGKAGK